jgi:hypothetical protein
MGFSITELNKRNTDYSLEPVFRIPNTEQIIVPDYVRPHEWVGLGGVTYTTDELINSRAKPEIKCLWTRPWTEYVIFKGKGRTLSPKELEILIRARQ